MSDLTTAILGFVGTSMPSAFAVASALAMARLSRRRFLLFFLLSLSTFCWISDLAYAWLVTYFAPDLVPLLAFAPVKGEAVALILVADCVGGVLGGIVVWQLARVLISQDPSD